MTSDPKKSWTFAIALLTVALWPLEIRAESISQAVSTSAAHLAEEQLGEASRGTEAAADRGLIHPDLSFNRGLAYMKRAQSASAEPGDLGQAAAGFAEALHLRAEDPEAERALQRTQQLLAEDAARSDTSPESSSLGLVERLLLFLNGWALLIIGGLGSITLCAGLFARSSSKEGRRVGGSVAALVGFALLAPTFLLFIAKLYLFDGARVAVVVAERAEVVDEGGGRVPGLLPYRMGTVVHIRERKRGLAPLVNFGTPGHLPTERLRFLRDPVQ